MQHFSTWTANRGEGVLLQLSFSNAISSEISKLYKLISNRYESIIPVTFSNSLSYMTASWYFNVLLFNLIWPKILSFVYSTYNMQGRRNAFHIRGGYGMLKKYYRPRYYCFFFAFQCLVFSFLVFFSGLVVKARIASHPFSKEFILFQS